MRTIFGLLTAATLAIAFAQVAHADDGKERQWVQVAADFVLRRDWSNCEKPKAGDVAVKCKKKIPDRNGASNVQKPNDVPPGEKKKIKQGQVSIVR